MLDIRKSTVDEIRSAPNFSELSQAYGQELIVSHGPSPSADVEAYKNLEASGVWRVFGAYYNDLLIGLVTVLVTVFPHYTATMAVTESFFVFKEWRKTGAGLKLLSVAKKYAKENGAPGLLVSAPISGVLAEILEQLENCVEVSRVFYMDLAHVE
jgi:GNAT superfamily N-acetyltransferase